MLLGEGNALLEPEGAIHQSGIALREKLQQLEIRSAHLTAVGQFTEQAVAINSELSLDELRQNCELMIVSEPRLRAWCAWRKIRDEAFAVGLAPIVEAMEKGAITLGNVRRVLEVNYARWWLNATVDNEAVIRTFVSAEHEQRIRDFRALDDKFTSLTRDWLRARLCSELPSQESVSRSSEWGLLRHEMSKKTRHMPLRELMSQAPGALTKLTPCLLMSPLSIAQYLPSGTTPFDLVIFDEASQIPVWDAIGAMARGRQVVMVGDPKQLPPTSFSGAQSLDLTMRTPKLTWKAFWMSASVPTSRLESSTGTIVAAMKVLSRSRTNAITSLSWLPFRRHSLRIKLSRFIRRWCV